MIEYLCTMVYNQHMKIGIYTNHNKDNNHLITSKLTKICENLGVDTVIYDDIIQGW